MSEQPDYEMVASLGDVNPIDYGGYYVYRDKTGVYEAQAEYFAEPAEGKKLEVYRFDLDKCTYVDGILSDNSFHPEMPAWFADNIDGVASSIGVEALHMIQQLCSDSPTDRAQAYRAIGEYHGFLNLDQYPIRLTRKEARERYNVGS